MAGTARFEVDDTRVVHDTVEEEVVVIDLDTGTYFSLRGAAADVWQDALAGGTADEVAAALERRYGQGFDARAVTTATLDGLLADGLLQPRSAPGEPARLVPRAPGPYAPPVREAFTDMQQYLLMDPIHEVAPTGWPNLRTG